MTPLWPGATIGILGGGQLARMLALEVIRMGYRVAVLDPDRDGPAAQLAHIHVAGALSDLQAAKQLAAHSDVVTLDTEHVPAALLHELEAIKPVRPRASVLSVVQDRLAQREFLHAHGVPQTDFASICTEEELAAAERAFSFPAVLKTRREGYDGKGQALVQSSTQLMAAWRSLGRAPAILEAFVDFDKEISILLARGLDREIRCYPIAENRHANHVLQSSHVPAAVAPALAAQAAALGARIADALDCVGMMAVELFVTASGQLLVNELAPRTHNSGHYTFGACVTSQFEQHVRAICGLPLGDTSLLRPALMLNLLGDLWHPTAPDWATLLAHPTAKLHLYGKQARAGRKMGHVLLFDDAAASAHKLAELLRGGGYREPARSTPRR